MIRKKTIAERAAPQIIDLDGPDGNAYVLIGLARSLSKRIGLDTESILQKMQSGDYENLIQVFDSYFSNHYVLVRNC